MYKVFISVALALASVCLNPTASARDLGPSVEIAGHFEFSPVTSQTAIAVWVPLIQGEVVESILWNGNIDSAEGPGLLAAASSGEAPPALAEFVEISDGLNASSATWNTEILPTRIASNLAGIYVVMRAGRPDVTGLDALNYGLELGYVNARDLTSVSWITGDGTNWHQVAAGNGPAIISIISTSKSVDTMVLGEELGDTGRRFKESVEKRQPRFDALSVAPNPFNPETTIRFKQEKAGPVTLDVFDLRGRHIRNLMSRVLPTGDHEIVWDGRDGNYRVAASGVYFVRYVSGSVAATTRVILVK